MTVHFNAAMVRDDESAGSLTFVLVTNRPADVSFTVQVCTADVDLGPDLGMATGIAFIALYETIKHVISTCTVATDCTICVVAVGIVV